MAKTLLVTAGAPTATTAGATQYWFLATAAISSPQLTEAPRQILYRSSGILSKLYVRVSANTTSANSSVTVRKNGVDTSLTVTITAGTAEVKEDTTNTVTVAAGDKLSYKTVSGGTGTMSMAVMSCVFQADNDAVTKLCCGPATATYVLDNVTRFAQVAGNLTPNTATESITKTKAIKPVTYRNLVVYASTNLRTSATIIRSRKNGVDGNITVTIPAGFVGWIEDTTNSDTVAIGDDYNWSVIMGAGAGETLGIHSISCDVVETVGGIGLFVVGQTSGLIQNINITSYISVAGSIGSAGTIEANTKLKTRETFTLSRLSIFPSTNAITTTSTLRLRINGVPGNQVCSIPASNPAVVTDTTHTDVVSATDEIDYELVTGATGTSMTVRNISMAHVLLTAPVIGSGGGSQGRSPLYRQVRREPEIAIAIVRVRIPLEYEVEKLSVQVPLPYRFVPEKKLIKYASAILTPLARILPLPIRPTPPPPEIKIVRVSIPLSYEVTNLQLKAACSYQVDRLFTQEEQHKIVATSINFLLSDLI
jgi:hypothetical protein